MKPEQSRSKATVASTIKTQNCTKLKTLNKINEPTQLNSIATLHTTCCQDCFYLYHTLFPVAAQLLLSHRSSIKVHQTTSSNQISNRHAFDLDYTIGLTQSDTLTNNQLKWPTSRPTLIPWMHCFQLLWLVSQCREAKQQNSWIVFEWCTLSMLRLCKQYWKILFVFRKAVQTSSIKR